MSHETYILAGGGTGGHLYPALAVAEALRAHRPGATILLACSDRPIDRRILEPTDLPCVAQPVRPVPRRAGQIAGFLIAWRRSMRLARQMLDDLQPRAVLGAGGFAAGPVVLVARRRGIPVGLLNPDAVPGLANRYLAARAGAIFTQFDETAGLLAAAVRPRVRRVGCPVRSALREGDRDRAAEHFDLARSRRTLLVLGGSLGAESINRAVTNLADELAARADRWQVLHITGPGKSPWATPTDGERAADATGRDGQDAPKRSGAPQSPPVRVVEYCRRMDLAYALADLAICRGGASTVAELIATGTPAICLPYPYHRDRHQQRNAEALGPAGRVVEDARDPAVNAERLRGILTELMDVPERLAEMRVAARRQSGRTAADDVARWMIRQGE